MSPLIASVRCGSLLWRRRRGYAPVAAPSAIFPLHRLAPSQLGRFRSCYPYKTRWVGTHSCCQFLRPLNRNLRVRRCLRGAQSPTRDTMMRRMPTLLQTSVAIVHLRLEGAHRNAARLPDMTIRGRHGTGCFDSISSVTEADGQCTVSALTPRCKATVPSWGPSAQRDLGLAMPDRLPWEEKETT